jgi:hypothetical protein
MEFKKISLHLAIVREKNKKQSPEPYLRMKQENNAQKTLPERVRDKLFGFYRSFTFNYLLCHKLSCIIRTAPDAAE